MGRQNDELFLSGPAVKWILLSALSLALVVLLDFVAPLSYAFSLFYLAPIGIAALRLSSPWAYIFTALSTTLWFLDALASGRHFDSTMVLLWTITTRTLTFGLFAYVLLRLRGLLAVSRRQVRELEAANAEKSLLFQELNHRVKNSLATVVGLIRLEEDSAPQKCSGLILDRLEHRVQSISALYDQLFGAAEIDSVNLGEYLAKIARFVAEASGGDERGVRVSTNLESVRIDAKRAISLGLIANELLTDCFKYAFPEGRGGSVSVRMRRVEGRLLIEIEDDGVGLPADFDPASATGFGLRLVEGLVCELGGVWQAAGVGGARFVIDLPYDYDKGED